MHHCGRVGRHAGVEQLGARDSDRLAKFEIKFRMRSIGAGDAGELLLDQVFDDRFACRKIVALCVDKAEDIGVVRLVADEELRRPMAKLRLRQLAALDLLDGRMRAKRAIVALKFFDQAFELAGSFFYVHDQFPCGIASPEADEARSAASFSAMSRRSSAFLILPTLVSGNSDTISIRSGHLNCARPRAARNSRIAEIARVSPSRRDT